MVTLNFSSIIVFVRVTSSTIRTAHLGGWALTEPINYVKQAADAVGGAPLAIMGALAALMAPAGDVTHKSTSR
jgi:hypothetical protein